MARVDHEVLRAALQPVGGAQLLGKV